MSGPAYDDNNIFAKILRGEIPCKKVHEDAHTLAFEDIHPQAPVHTLVIPKGPYVSMQDFAAHAGDAEIAAFVRAIGKVAALKGVEDDGFRILANAGVNGGQEVPHLHVHIFGGRPLGPMLSRT
ncbi:MAG: histidine triad nucleotide-binding protein [Rhodospirillaceae bacterium]